MMILYLLSYSPTERIKLIQGVPKKMWLKPIFEFGSLDPLFFSQGISVAPFRKFETKCYKVLARNGSENVSKNY